MQEAPVFYPSQEEWQQPMKYIDSIRTAAEAAGICKIVPPADWTPPFAINKKKFKLNTRIQNLSKLNATARIEYEFVDKLRKYLYKNGTPMNINNLPKINNKNVNFHTLFKIVVNHDGYEKVCENEKWPAVFEELYNRNDPSPGDIQVLQQGYQKYLLDYEKANKFISQNKRKVENGDEDGEEQNQEANKRLKTSEKSVEKQNLEDLAPKIVVGGHFWKYFPEYERCLLGIIESRCRSYEEEPNDREVYWRIRYPCRTIDNNKIMKDERETLAGDTLSILVASGKTPDEAYEAMTDGICQACLRANKPELLLLCDSCNFAYHTTCLEKPLEKIPDGDWFCPVCLNASEEAEALERRQEHENENSFVMNILPNEDQSQVKSSNQLTPNETVAAASNKSKLAAFGFDDGSSYTLNDFGEYADEFKSKYITSHNLPIDQNMTQEEVEEVIEKEFWNILSSKRTDHLDSVDQDIRVLYGSDLDTGVLGSGFPTKKSIAKLEQKLAALKLALYNSNSLGHVPPSRAIKDLESKLSLYNQYANDGWNLNNLPTLNGSLLQHVEADITGVMVPWLYVGMVFSSFCWHTEDHYFASINYLHWGESKTWYGVPYSGADEFERVARELAPELFIARPDILTGIVTMFSPEDLVKRKVSVYHTVQRQGEFVITFPRAYHGGFNHGLNCAEAVNFATCKWLSFGDLCVERYSKLSKTPIISHESLLCTLALLTSSICDLEYIKTAQHLYPSLHQLYQHEQRMRQVIFDKYAVKLITQEALDEEKKKIEAATNTTPKKQGVDRLRSEPSRFKSSPGRSSKQQGRTHAVTRHERMARMNHKIRKSRMGSMSGVMRVFKGAPQCHVCQRYCPLSYVRQEFRGKQIVVCLNHVDNLRGRDDRELELVELWPMEKLKQLVDTVGLKAIDQLKWRECIRRLFSDEKQAPEQPWQEEFLHPTVQVVNKLVQSYDSNSIEDHSILWTDKMVNAIVEEHGMMDIESVSDLNSPEYVSKWSNPFKEGVRPLLSEVKMFINKASKVPISCNNVDIYLLISIVTEMQSFTSLLSAILPSSYQIRHHLTNFANRTLMTNKKSIYTTNRLVYKYKANPFEYTKLLDAKKQYSNLRLSLPEENLESLHAMIKYVEEWISSVNQEVVNNDDSYLLSISFDELNRQLDELVSNIDAIDELQIELELRKTVVNAYNKRLWLSKARQILNLATKNQAANQLLIDNNVFEISAIIDEFAVKEIECQAFSLDAVSELLSNSEVCCIDTGKQEEYLALKSACDKVMEWNHGIMNFKLKSLMSIEEIHTLYNESQLFLFPAMEAIKLIVNKLKLLQNVFQKISNMMNLKSADDEKVKEIYATRLFNEANTLGVTIKDKEYSHLLNLITSINRWRSKAENLFITQKTLKACKDKETSSKTNWSLYKAFQAVINRMGPIENVMIINKNADIQSIQTAKMKKKQMKEQAKFDVKTEIQEAKNQVKLKNEKHLFCKCAQPEVENVFMIGCDYCNDWYHPACIGMSIEEAEVVKKYKCPTCSLDDKFVELVNHKLNADPETQAQNKDVKLYCVCRQPHNENSSIEMVECGSCNEWYHPGCIGLVDLSKLIKSEQFMCESCCTRFDVPSNVYNGLNGYYNMRKMRKQYLDEFCSNYNANGEFVTKRPKLLAVEQLILAAKEFPCVVKEYDLLLKLVEYTNTWTASCFKENQNSYHDSSTRELWNYLLGETRLIVQPNRDELRKIEFELWCRHVKNILSDNIMEKNRNNNEAPRPLDSTLKLVSVIELMAIKRLMNCLKQDNLLDLFQSSLSNSSLPYYEYLQQVQALSTKLAVYEKFVADLSKLNAVKHKPPSSFDESAWRDALQEQLRLKDSFADFPPSVSRLFNELSDALFRTDEEMEDNFSPLKLYCTCRCLYKEGDLMIQCETCDDWYHPKCVNADAESLETFTCATCVTKHPQPVS